MYEASLYGLELSGARTVIWSRFALTAGSPVTYPGAVSSGGNFGLDATGATYFKASDASQRFNGHSLRCLSTAVEGEEKWKRLSPSSHSPPQNYILQNFFTKNTSNLFVRSGVVNVSFSNDVTSRSIGLNEDVWSRAAAAWGSVIYGSDTNSTAYNLYFNAAITAGTSVDPSNAAHRRYGFPLRCLSTAGEGEESRAMI